MRPKPKALVRRARGRVVASPRVRFLRYWRHRLLRTSARALAAGALALIVLATVVAFVPWSWSVVDRRIQETWARATGLGLNYERATIRLSDGRVEIDHPALLDPETDARLVEFDRVTIQLDPFQFLMGAPPWVVNDVRVEGDTLITLLAHEGRLTWGPPWDRIARALERHAPDDAVAPSSASIPTFGLKQFSLGVARLRLIDTGGGEPRSVVRLDRVTIDADCAGGVSPHRVLVEGLLIGRDGQHPVSLSLRPDLSRLQTSFHLKLDRFDSIRDMAYRLPVDFTTEALGVRGQLRHTPPHHWALNGRIEADALELRERRGDERLALGTTRVECALRLDWNRNLWRLVRFDVDNDLGRVALAGTIRNRIPFPYDLRVERLALRPPGVRRLCAALVGCDLSAPDEAARLEVSGRVAGRILERRPREWTGRVEAEGLTWSPSAWPDPVTHLSARADLSTSGLTLDPVEGRIGGLAFTLNGHTPSHPLRDPEIESLQLEGSVRGRLDAWAPWADAEVSSRVQALRLTADVDGRASAQIDEPIPWTLAGLDTAARLSGHLQIESGRLDHAFDAPSLDRVRGRVEFTPKRLGLSELTGRWMGLDWALDGTCSHEAGWRRARPRVTGALSIAGALDDLAAWAAQRLRETDARVALYPRPGSGGQLDAALTFSTHSTDSAAGSLVDWDGEIDVQGGGAFISSPLVSGPIDVDRFHAICDPTRVRLVQAEARLGGVQLAATGDLGPEAGDATLTLEGDLADYAAAVPLLDEYFRVDGAAKIIHHAALRATTASREATWGDWLRRARREDVAPAEALDWLTERWTVDNDGEVFLEDAEVTYYAMPAPIRHITGRARYDAHEFWTPDYIRATSSDGCRDLIGKVRFLHGRAPTPYRLDFHVKGGHMVIGPWLQEWDFVKSGRKIFPSDDVFDPSKPPLFELHGRFDTDSANCWGVEGTHVTGNLDYTEYTDQGSLLEWRDVTADVYGGRLDVEGRIFNWGLTNKVETEDVRVADLVAAVLPEKKLGSICSGRITGRLDLAHRFNQTPSGPITGSGHLRVEESRFISNAMLIGLGGLLSLPVFEDITFTTIHGPFEMIDSRVATPEMVFDHPILNMTLSGAIEDWTLDADLQLQLLDAARKVPVLAQAVGLLNWLTGRALRFHVNGPLDDPDVQALTPLTPQAEPDRPDPLP